MSEPSTVAVITPPPENQPSRLEQRIRSLTEQLVQARGELCRAQERIAALTRIDEETGLLTARAFHERALVEVERASRYDRALALVLLAPDVPAALTSLAELCRTQCRVMDAVGRIDDGAIALLLPETALPGALVIAERICAMGRRRGAPASAGCAALPAQVGALSRLTAAARQALAIARAGGGSPVRSVSLS